MKKDNLRYLIFYQLLYLYLFFFIDILCLDELNVMIKSGEIYIYYVFNVLDNFLIVNDIKWIKDELFFELLSNKYCGGGLVDDCFIILRLGEDVKGLYICIVYNVVGFVLKSIKLGMILYV